MSVPVGAFPMPPQAPMDNHQVLVRLIQVALAFENQGTIEGLTKLADLIDEIAFHDIVKY